MIQIALNEKVTRAIANFSSKDETRRGIGHIKIDRHPFGIGLRMIATNGHCLIVSHLPTSYILESTIPRDADIPKEFYLYAGKSLYSRFKGSPIHRVGLCLDRPETTPINAKLKVLEFDCNQFGEWENKWEGDPEMDKFPSVDKVAILDPKEMRKRMKPHRVALINRHFLGMMDLPLSDFWETKNILNGNNNIVEFYSDPDDDYKLRAHYAVSSDNSVMILIMPLHGER